MSDLCLKILDVGTDKASRRIAVRQRAGASPGLLWLGGFNSDMGGTKAVALDAWARDHGRACIRFDYSGHGESEGAFRAGTIGRWLEESHAVFRARCHGPTVLVGSSMGGWIALLLARALRNEPQGKEPQGTGTLAAIVLIAPAVDFTEALMWERFDEATRRELMEKGVLPAKEPDHGPVTRRLIEEGRNHLMLGGLIRAHARVHILQGMRDEAVPWRHALTIVEHLNADPATLTFIADGDHRLSHPQDLAQLAAAVETMSAPPPGEPPPGLFD